MKIYRAVDDLWICEFMCVDAAGTPYQRKVTGATKREVKRKAKEEINANRTEALERKKQELGQQKPAKSSKGSGNSDLTGELAGCALEGCLEVLMDMIFDR